MSKELYFEDLHPGMTFNSSRSYKVTADEIKEFGERYDPQPFHIDQSAGESSFFKGLAASGWLWWRGPPRLSGLGASVLPASFLAEAAVAYAWRLHYYSSAVLLAVIGMAVLGLTGLRGRQLGRAAVWLLVSFPAAAAAEVLLDLLYRQRF